jgi:nitrile hydratase
LTGLCTVLAERGTIERAAVAGLPLSGPVGDVHPLQAADGVPASFSVGDRVRVREFQTGGHTRCPRYVRGRAGVVERVDGSFALPDVEAHAEHPPAEPTYCVRFDARELWGETAEPGVGVSVDLWHSYLEPAR